MAERDEGALERAEGFFKRVLERIGSSVDEKLAPSDARLPAHVVGALAAAVERAIEEGIRPDSRGVRRLAPDRFTVMLTYEQNAQIAEGERQAIARELAATAYEYIVNHRYETLARVYVELGCDIFAKRTQVDVAFSPAPGETSDGAVREVRPTAAGEVKAPRSSESVFLIIGPGGKPVHRVELQPGGEPLTVGRAAGNRIPIDHDSVSKFHATLTLARDNTLVLADLGSTNGTFVNRESSRVTGARAISPGDTVVFGEVPYTIEKV
jgi:hypothetical protein